MTPQRMAAATTHLWALVRTHLRARAYTHENDFAPVEPAAYADACVQLLSVEGAAWRGQIRDLLA